MNENNNSYTSRINISDRYVIINDGMNFSLNRRSVAKNGNENLNVIGHFGSLEKALIACKKEYARNELLKMGSVSLDEAVSIIVRSNNHFESLIKNAFEGVTV